LDVTLVVDREVSACPAGRANLNRFDPLGSLLIFNAAGRSLREPADVADVFNGALVFETQEIVGTIELEDYRFELTRLALAPGPLRIRQELVAERLNPDKP
jgi:hypothetical protein